MTYLNFINEVKTEYIKAHEDAVYLCNIARDIAIKKKQLPCFNTFQHDVQQVLRGHLTVGSYIVEYDMLSDTVSPGKASFNVRCHVFRLKLLDKLIEREQSYPTRVSLISWRK